MTVWESRTPPDIHYERAPTGNNRSGPFCVCRKIGDIGELNRGTTAPSTQDEWSQAPCLMTSLPAALVMTTLVGTPLPGAPGAAETVVVRVPAVNEAVVQTVIRAVGLEVGQAMVRLGVGLSVMTGSRVEVHGGTAGGVIGGVTRGRTGGRSVVPGAGPTVRAPGVARC